MKFINNQNKIKYGNPNQFGYEFNWNQAKVFYNVAKVLSLEASPVAAYDGQPTVALTHNLTFNTREM